MRAAFLTTEVLGDEPEGRAALDSVAGVGLRPVLIASADARPDDWYVAGATVPVVYSDGATGSSWGEHADALVKAAVAADVNLGEAFLVCRNAEDVLRGLEMGCRPVLVLGDRSLGELLGAHEPDGKGFAVALDLPTAIDYIVAETEQDRTLGPFPFGTHRSMEERSAALLPTTGDLAKIFVMVTAAGVAVALGIAYLLQEVYQRVTFPAVAYWLTLQFIPQTFRGLLFLIIGAGAGLFAQRVWHRLNARRAATSSAGR